MMPAIHKVREKSRARPGMLVMQTQPSSRCNSQFCSGAALLSHNQTPLCSAGRKYGKNLPDKRKAPPEQLLTGHISLTFIVAWASCAQSEEPIHPSEPAGGRPEYCPSSLRAARPGSGCFGAYLYPASDKAPDAGNRDESVASG